MYRTVIFNSAFPNEWKFDEYDIPTAPGARELAELIASKLRLHVRSVSAVDQHEYYGWAFAATTEYATFYNVLNPVDECYLTVSMDWYATKALLLQRPREKFDRYCEALTDALGEIAEVSNIQWEDYRR